MMHRRAGKKQGGFTLVEVLVATAVALVLMVGLSQVFKVLGDSITKGRAGLELNNRLRNVSLRIRGDLDNLTVYDNAGPLRPPFPAGSGKGYLKYYDGPMTDFTLSFVDPSDSDLSNGLSSNFNQANPFLSRFGDLDDIFMATVKASDTWFTGKVPRFIVEKRAPNPAIGILAELNDRVTIASEFAEIIIFAQPLPSSVGNPSRDAAVLAAAPTTAFEDSFSGISNASDSIPDGFRLHYRQLLIRPDLNLPSGVLPHFVDNALVSASNPLNRAMVAGPESLAPFGPNSLLPSPECDMYRIHQCCDLSVRRVNDFNPNTLDLVAANDLSDLQNQSSELTKPFPLSGGAANRFAHVQHRIGNTAFWSMPVLALGSALPFQFNDSSMLAKMGFLHPAFVLLGDRRGEDLLATDLLAFDIRAFDPNAPLVDASGTILRPGDPGFRDPGLSGLNAVNRPVALGEFVDVDWGSTTKLPNPLSIIDFNYQGRFLNGELSGVTVPAPPLALTRIRRSSLAASGNYLMTPSGDLLIDQPCYDTYSDYFENDLIRHGTLGVNSIGVVEDRSGQPAETVPITSAPFVMDLRGIQISVRLEDAATKQFKQMTSVKSFSSN